MTRPTILLAALAAVALAVGLFLRSDGASQPPAVEASGVSGPQGGRIHGGDRSRRGQVPSRDIGVVVGAKVDDQGTPDDTGDRDAVGLEPRLACTVGVHQQDRHVAGVAGMALSGGVEVAKG